MTLIRRPLILAGFLAAGLWSGAHAQAPVRFTVDDVLELTNANVADVTADGKFAVITTASLRDRIGVDNSRYGDPTYVAPSVADVWIVETASGKAQRMFPDKRQVRGFRWSPDGRLLAYSALRNGAFEPMLWDRSTGKSTAIKIPANTVLADGELQWSDDGKTLLLPLRDASWAQRARQRFGGLTTDSIIVQSGKDPFLAWDDLGRMRLEQSLALYEVSSGRIRTAVPSNLIRTYDLSSDGTFIIYQHDITKKTDYDVIGG